MSDEHDERRAAARPDTDDPSIRVHSDIARLVDLQRLEHGVMSAVRTNTETMAGVSRRVNSMRDELSGYVVQHAQNHASMAGDWEQRWSGMAVEIAYRKGLIGWPRLVLEWLRQYLTTLLVLGGLIATVVGFLTGSVQIGVGDPP